MFATKRHGLKRKLVLIVKYDDRKIKCLGPKEKVLKASWS